MKDSPKKPCLICEKLFPVDDLYPTSLIRNSLLTAAAKQYPSLIHEGFLCPDDLQMIRRRHLEKHLRKEKGTLSQLENEVLDSLQKQELLTDNVNEEYDEKLTIGERLADKIARFGGSWPFILFFFFILVSWMGINSFYFNEIPFDPYPFILLNLVLSCLAAIQAPIIMMSQNRQSFKDRLSQENDYQVNLKSELQIRHLNARLEHFMRRNWQKTEEIMEEIEALSSKLGQLDKK